MLLHRASSQPRNIVDDFEVFLQSRNNNYKKENVDISTCLFSFLLAERYPLLVEELFFQLIMSQGLSKHGLNLLLHSVRQRHITMFIHYKYHETDSNTFPAFLRALALRESMYTRAIALMHLSMSFPPSYQTTWGILTLPNVKFGAVGIGPNCPYFRGTVPTFLGLSL